MKPVNILASKYGILLVDKPTGMITHTNNGHASSYQGLELWELADRLIPGAHVANRIDKPASGIVVVGNAKEKVDFVQKYWHETGFSTKEYLAIVETPSWNEEIVDLPIEGEVRGERALLDAETGFRVLQRGDVYSLVLCKLLNFGRRHQIRIHLTSLGSPIVGDVWYGGKASAMRPGPLLHSWKTSILLPDQTAPKGCLIPGREVISAQAPIPDDLRAYPFDWNEWDKGASRTIKSWSVPDTWVRKPRQ